jgi:hypothetical protein
VKCLDQCSAQYRQVGPTNSPSALSVAERTAAIAIGGQDQWLVFKDKRCRG